MMAVIAMPESTWTGAEEHLWAINDDLKSPSEKFGFFLAGVAKTTEGPRFAVQEFIPIADEDVEFHGRGAYEVDLEAILGVINKAKRMGLAIIEIHTHPLTKTNVTFSTLTDEQEMPEFAAYVLDSLDGTPYGAIVLGRESIDARYWSKPGEGTAVERIVVAGEHLDVQFTTSGSQSSEAPDNLEDRYDRQIRAFSKEGQDRLQTLRVGIIGLGGLGSHVAQQLAYAGVRDFVLVDPDEIEVSNLNRTVTAVPNDVNKPKVRVAAASIEDNVNGEVSVTTFETDVRDEEALQTLLTTDLVVGSLDNDGPRLVLNRLARAAHLPYFDLATGINPPDGPVEQLGGRVAIIHPDGPCLHCLHEIDREEARDFLAPAEVSAEDRDLGYIEDVKNPSVVSLNGEVASMGVSEILIYATQFGAVSPLHYHYLREPGQQTQRTASRRVNVDADCFTCSRSGDGDAAKITNWEI
jgi:molybdopterin/thiamine biosynthesis adenylyltransferase